MHTDAGFPSSFYDGVIEAFVITGTVQSDIATIELVADVQEILLELEWALACQENKIKLATGTQLGSPRASTITLHHSDKVCVRGAPKIFINN